MTLVFRIPEVVDGLRESANASFVYSSVVGGRVALGGLGVLVWLLVGVALLHVLLVSMV